MAVPVNLRTPAQMAGLGNSFGLVFLELPLWIEDPWARFREVKRRMDRLKRSPEAYVLLAMMQIAGTVPRWVEELIVRFLGAKTTGVLTNVPGPREPRYLAGRRIPHLDVLGAAERPGRAGREHRELRRRGANGALCRRAADAGPGARARGTLDSSSTRCVVEHAPGSTRRVVAHLHPARVGGHVGSGSPMGPCWSVSNAWRPALPPASSCASTKTRFTDG